MWARLARVHQVLAPVTRYSSACRTARVLMAAVSEPASGSVNAAAVSRSPPAIPGRKRCFCSSVPCAKRSVPVIRFRVITEPTLSHARDSSSATMAMLA